MNSTPFASTAELLAALGWPANALDQKGALSWGCPVGEPPDRVIGAAVICRADAVVCRLRAHELDVGSLHKTHLEAIWAIAPDAAPVLRSVQKAGEPVEADAATALGWFQDTVNTMCTRPEFQAMGTRDRPAQASRPRAAA